MVPGTPCEAPGSGPLRKGRARCQGPSHASAAPTRQLTGYPRKEERSHKSDRKKLSFQNETERKEGGARRGPGTQISPAGEGENQALPGMSPSPLSHPRNVEKVVENSNSWYNLQCKGAKSTRFLR
jgi:hypothetical protein